MEDLHSSQIHPHLSQTERDAHLLTFLAHLAKEERRTPSGLTRIHFMLLNNNTVHFYNDWTDWIKLNSHCIIRIPLKELEIGVIQVLPAVLTLEWWCLNAKQKHITLIMAELQTFQL